MFRSSLCRALARGSAVLVLVTGIGVGASSQAIADPGPQPSPTASAAVTPKTAPGAHANGGSAWMQRQVLPPSRSNEATRKGPLPTTVMAAATATSSITLPVKSSVWVYVAAQDALNQASVSLSSPSAVGVCNPCSAGQQAAVGSYPAGSNLVFTFADVSCGQSWPSTDSTHLQITTLAAGIWQIGYDDAGASCSSSDSDFNDLVVDVVAESVTAPEAFGPASGQGLENGTHCQTSKPVDCATGNFSHTFTDFAFPGRGIPISLSRSYNSLNAQTPGLFGYGWSSTYDMHLSFDSGGNAIVTQEGGATATFNPNGSGGWIAPPKVLGGLVTNADGTYTLTRRGRERFTFAANGGLVALSDLNGYQTRLAYDAGGQLATVTDAAGRTLTFTHASASGLVTGVADSAGRAVSYGYDAAGNLTSVTDVGGGLTRFTYDAGHLLLTMTEPGSATALVNVYDGSARVVKQTDAAGRVTTWVYGDSTTTITDPNGNVTALTYTDGMLTSAVKGSGTTSAATWRYAYDQTLGVATTTDPNGHAWSATYDLNGNEVATRDPLGRSTSSAYNGFDERTRATDANGYSTSYNYDGQGNLQSVTRPLTSTGQTQATTYTYGDAAHPGDVTAITDPDAHVTSMTYDGYGDLASKTDALGNVTTYDFSCSGTAATGCYVGAGLLYGVVTPRGNVSGGNPAAFRTAMTYNAYGDRLTVTDPLGHVSTSTYDAKRNLKTQQDGLGHVTTYGYDADDELTTVTQPDQSVVRYGYDGDGNRTSITDGNGKAVTNSFANPALPNSMTSTVDAAGRATTLGYDPAGNLVRKQQPGGNCAAAPATGCVTYGYDAANQRTSIAYSDGKTATVTIGYDADGNRLSMADGTGTSFWSWNSLNQLVSTTNGAGATVGYGYDLAGNLTTIAYPGSTGTVTRTYDADNRLSAVTDWAGHQTTYSYDADSNLSSQLLPNGITSAYTADAAGNINHMASTTAGAPGSTLLSLDYTRDADNQITATQATGVPADNNSYTYTSRNQVKTAGAATYAYDPAGNPTQLAAAGTQSFDAVDQLTGQQKGITVVGTGTAATTNAKSLSVALPSGVLAGDQILVSVTSLTGQSVKTPTGYTLVNTYKTGNGTSSGQLALFRKTAAGGELSVDFTLGSNKFATAAVATVYRGVSTTNPLDGTTSGTAAAATTVTAPSLTTTQADRVVVFDGAAGTTAAATWTPPTGATTRVAQSAGGSVSAIAADIAQAAPGATGALTSKSSTSGQLVSAVVALRPSGTAFGYDTRGNRTSVTPAAGTATSLGYDQANRLTAYGTAATYAYNGDGLRMSKTVSGATSSYAWDMAEQTPLLLSDGATSYVYGLDGLPLEQVAAGGTLYYLHDDLGSTRMLTNSSAAAVATYTFDAYGQLAASTGSVANPLLYGGQYRDAESGYHYLRARYYDPSTAQFLSRDPVEQMTGTPYVYANGNPVNSADPTGLMPAPEGGADSSCSNDESSNWIAYFLLGASNATDLGGDVAEALERRASVLGRIMSTSDNPAARSYAAGLLRGAGRLNDNPVLKGLGKAAGPVGAALEFGSDLADGDGVGKSALKTAGAVGGGAAGAALGSAACGAETVATFGVGSLACPFIVGGLGAAGSWVGSKVGGKVAGWLGL